MVEMTMEEALARLQQDEQRLQAMEQNALDITRALQDAGLTKNTLENLPNAESGTLIPLRGGVYLPAKANPGANLLVEVGEGAVVEKTVEEALEIVERREKQLQAALQQIQESAAEIQRQRGAIQAKVSEYVEKQKGQPGMPVIGD